MEPLTFRFVLERKALELLFAEKEFREHIGLSASLIVKPVAEHFLVICVFAAHPRPGGKTSLQILSTTVLGIQRYTTTRLRYQGVYVLERPAFDGFLMEAIRAHYRADQIRLNEQTTSAGSGIPMRWRANFPSGAGDIDTESFVIDDPDLQTLERLFSLRDGRREDDQKD